MGKILNTYLVLTMVLVASTVRAQQDHTLFFMDAIPQANIVNPALAPACDTYFGVPGLASVHVNYNNTALKINELFYPDKVNDTLQVNVGGIIDKLNGKEMLTQEVFVSLFSVGHRIKNTYFTFAITEKQNTYEIISENVAKLYWKGNSPFVGEELNLNGARFNFNHYREYALGASKDISDKFRFGAKAKLLFGKANIYTSNTKGSLFTDKTTFALDGKADAKIYVNLPVTIDTDSAGFIQNAYRQPGVSVTDYLRNSHNMGFALDAGFVFKQSDQITLSGSLLNLGFVRWKSNPYTMNPSGEIVYGGVGRENTVDGGGNISNAIDSIMHVFKVTPIQEAYTTPLAPEIYIGGTYAFNEKLNAGLVLHSHFYRWRLLPSMALSLNTKLIKNLHASASYTLQNGSYDNLGLGISVKLGALQLHAMSDHVLGLAYWDNTRNLNLRFGATLVFGCPDDKVKNKKPRHKVDCDCVGDPYGEYRWSGRRKQR